jgi:hypothetical protein
MTSGIVIIGRFNLWDGSVADSCFFNSFFPRPNTSRLQASGLFPGESISEGKLNAGAASGVSPVIRKATLLWFEICAGYTSVCRKRFATAATLYVLYAAREVSEVPHDKDGPVILADRCSRGCAAS